MLLAVVLMLAYGYMTDLGDSMLRAMGMMALVLTGELLGRKTDLMTSLLFTGGLMVLFRPERLLSAGFLLSFGAVGGMAFGEWLWQFFSKEREKSGDKEPVSAWLLYPIRYFPCDHTSGFMEYV